MKHPLNKNNDQFKIQSQQLINEPDLNRSLPPPTP